MKNMLLNILLEKSFKYSDNPVFKLASGRMSNYYVNCKETTLYSKGLSLIGNIFFDKIKDLKISGIGGLTLGSDPIAVSTALIAGQNEIDLISFIVRKEPKKHGLMKWIEGGINSGDRVVVIDDVMTTGGSLIQAIEKAEESELEIVKVLILVDREEGGRENVETKGYEVESIFKRTELMRTSKANRRNTDIGI